jgi:hypothetical protein
MPKDVIIRMQLKTLTATAAIVTAGLPAAAALAADTQNTDTTGRTDLRLTESLHEDGVVQLMRDRGRRLERHRKLVSANVRLARTEARLRGERLRGDRRERVDDWANRRLNASNRHLRTRIRDLRAGAEAPAPVQGGSTATAGLQAIAACESGGDPGAVDASGTYRGKYQFDRQTWSSVGGSGDPAAAPEAEQDRRAAMLMARSGSNPWPVCGS